MTPELVAPLHWLANRTGRLQAAVLPHGGLQSLRCEALTLNLFAGTALEAGPANLWLRLRGDAGVLQAVPLLGPAAPGRQQQPAGGGAPWHQGLWAIDAHRQAAYTVQLVLAEAADHWFWHVQLHNLGTQALQLDLVYLQDVALAPWPAIRLNEAYVSQYLDHQPLQHPQQGWVVATRQNQPVAGRVPWLLSGSLGQASAFATDALQVLGLGVRASPGAGPLLQDLPSQRLQHEHALVGLQEAAFALAPGERCHKGFYGALLADHPTASSAADLALVAQVRAQPEAMAPAVPQPGLATATQPNNPHNRLANAPVWPSATPSIAQLQAWFGSDWRHVESTPDGQVLSFFTDEATHVVSRAHELRVLRPHGHMLRSGSHWTPDERGVASTVWMAGVFHSSLTQGHASANRCLSTQRGYLGLFRGLGQRVLVDAGQGWRLLDVPSAWQVSPVSATWLYQAGDSLIEVQASADAQSPSVAVRLQVRAGPALRVLVSHHVALNGPDGADDGLAAVPVQWHSLTGDESDQTLALAIAPSAGSDMAQRFGSGGLRLQAQADAPLCALGDEALFDDGHSRSQPYLCLRADGLRQLSIQLHCTLIDAATPQPAPLPGPVQPPLWGWTLPQGATDGAASQQALAQLGEWLPWLAHNALVHYLSPRGLEQFSGGGWGTRDVCQGPAELLLALGRHDALRDLLLRVFSAQNPDGDWPQWFMFYARDAHIRAGDSHGDIVFWPLVALADYLVASGDASILDQALPFHGDAQAWPLTEHVQRALSVIRQRTIAGTQLAAYGHGDWNDALQPANPAMRDHLCSAWTVTLHHRMLRGLAAAWAQAGRHDEAAQFTQWAQAVLSDFQRLLVVDGVVTGYADFAQPDALGYLLHPRDARTGIHFSALPMVHAIVDELFTPEQAQAHVALMGRELTGPDGLRLFDKPLRYSGGPMRLFQRGESASYFGREIGLMYTHAHLRWAEALARLGHADAFLAALQRINPIGLRALVPQAAARQRNCYYSSSDAAFADRQQAWQDYGQINSGQVALEGGWRVYSSGAGIAYRLVLQCLLGLVQQQHRLGIDPVMPASLSGLQVQLPLYGHPLTVRYRVGPAGHGPTSVHLDGQALALQPGSNRYRRAGVWVDAEDLRQRLAAGAKVLEIGLG